MLLNKVMIHKRAVLVLGVQVSVFKDPGLCSGSGLGLEGSRSRGLDLVGSDFVKILYCVG